MPDPVLLTELNAIRSDTLTGELLTQQSFTMIDEPRVIVISYDYDINEDPTTASVTESTHYGQSLNLYTAAFEISPDPDAEKPHARARSFVQERLKARPRRLVKVEP